MVGVLVGDEDVVGTGHGSEVRLGLQSRHGVEVEEHAIVLYLYAGMFDARKLDLLAVRSLQHVRLALCPDGEHCTQGTNYETNNNEQLFHIFSIFLFYNIFGIYCFSRTKGT